MLEKLISLRSDYRSFGGEKLLMSQVVVHKTDPGVEKKVPFHGFEETPLHVRFHS